MEENKGFMMNKVEEKNKLGDGVAWCRGAMIGKGNFGSVYLATLKKPRSRYGYYPSVMAVKSAEVSVSGTIQKEREVLNNVQGCCDILKCFGDEITRGENGEMVYNLLLQYGSGGTLADLIKKSSGNGLPESDVRRYTRCILRGLNHIHESGYVHCDLKPDNILLVPTNNPGCNVSGLKAKIGDFGLSKRANNKNKKRKLEPYWRGTPLYLSPEAVVDNLQEPPSDIWALGCIVLEMLTRKPPWNNGEADYNVDDILKKIGDKHELPKIPLGISKEGRDFLKGCFVRNYRFRLTAEMLLNHPFVEGLVDDDDEIDDEIEELEEADEIEELEADEIEELEANEIEELEEANEELSYSSFSDSESFLSEEETFLYFSENADGMDTPEVSGFDEETLEAEESRGVLNMTSNLVNAASGQLIKTSPQVLEVPSAVTQQQHISLTIHAGI